MKEIINKDLMEELGISSLPEEEKNKVMERIGKLIYQSVIIRVLEKLDENDVDEFEKIVHSVQDSNEGAENILKFLRSKIVDFDEIVTEEISTFKQEGLNAISEIK